MYAHSYHDHPPPSPPLAFAFIDRWAPLAARMPRVANFLTQTPALAPLARRLLGVAPHWPIAPLAPVPFTTAYSIRPTLRPQGKRVILWPDTFYNYFRPETAESAFMVLEEAGCRVCLPPEPLCCGRALYEAGMPDRARARLRRVLDALAPDIAADTPVVVLEPGCAAMFREILPILFPQDRQAARLARQTLTLADFLQRIEPEIPFRALRCKALILPHGRSTGVVKLDAERALMKRLGLRVETLESGCPGPAGAGSDAQAAHRTETAFCTAVGRAPPGTLIIANDFCCAEHVRHTCGRSALHLADVLRMAIAA